MKQFLMDLPPEEREQVRNGILDLDAKMKTWEKQKVIIREMRARHKQSGGLKRLLEERAKERLGQSLVAAQAS